MAGSFHQKIVGCILVAKTVAKTSYEATHQYNSSPPTAKPFVAYLFVFKRLESPKLLAPEQVTGDRARSLGAGGRRFESDHPDQFQ
jgi:hypothetical protein